MTFLELVNRLRLESGVVGTDLVTLSSLSAEMARLKAWISNSWLDLQSIHQDWDWMRKSASFPTVAGQGIYTLADMAITDHGKWNELTFRNYSTSMGTNSEVFMSNMQYDTWRNTYYYNALRNTRSRPMEIAVSPDKGICLGPVPGAGYTITGDYWHAPTALVDPTDTPDMPAHFHMAIVWKALMTYGLFEAAPEAKLRGEMEFTKFLQRLENDRKIRFNFGGALA